MKTESGAIDDYHNNRADYTLKLCDDYLLEIF